MALLKSGRQSEAASEGAPAARGAPVDPMHAIRRKARQRLIGAALLALVAVIGLPMVLDTAPKPVSQDVSITIPSKDTPFKPDAPPAAPSPQKARPSSTTDVKPAAPPTPAPAAAKPVVAPAPAGAAAAPPPAPTEAARALAALEGRDVRSDAVKSDPKFAVQLGAFSSASKARDLQARLKSAGIATYTEALATEAGERIRVRAGPFASREAAEAVRAQAAAHGIAGATLVPL